MLAVLRTIMIGSRNFISQESEDGLLNFAFRRKINKLEQDLENMTDSLLRIREKMLNV